jgi:CBS domain-containing protein
LLDLSVMTSDEPIRARDLMSGDVITVAPSTPILDVHRLFVEEEIHGAPVVDENGVVVGVVSALDLLRVVRDEIDAGSGASTTTYFRDELPYAGLDWLNMPEDFAERMQMLTAEDAMTRELVMVGLDDTADEIARTMLEHHVHRVLVGDRETLSGVITTFDLLRVLSRAQAPYPRLTQPTGYTRGPS